MCDMVKKIETKKLTKKEMIKLLLNEELSDENHEDLMNLLFSEPVAIDVDKQEEKKMTKGDMLADKISEKAGSWGFIIGFTSFLVFWIALNALNVIKLDEYPFILLNLLLSCLAALQAPVIMMSQNRQAKKDSLRNQNDYRTDLKSELINEEIYRKLEQILRNQREIIKYLRDDSDKE